ncbi:hypothetical protein BU23DRAFT_183013 [Bimuria novae-zelandiae CBS 107.79]|uniref:F-box domain-containing protein n=1 Tax=Bimuria novae-zelandiae CBS 107.79 TaxID=1447943 RepID=A0A6A5V365_9PLEO|nr:hypothetical protein BU23DRAFT_183013 [Bimuria novae-zelandiae CBS 107.79]
MSDVLNGVDTPTPIEEVESSILEDVAEVQSLSDESFEIPRPTLSLIISVLSKGLLPYLDRNCRKALRSTCKEWCAAIDGLDPPKPPASRRAPTEILHHIYKYLGPKDFNAARHTCRHWMGASLDTKLLCTMLERGGWWSSTEAAVVRRANLTSPESCLVNRKNPWLLSRLLSRECALSSGWTGLGLRGKEDRDPGIFAEVSTNDFTDLANGHSNGRGTGRLIYTTSICGQFLLVGYETIIYVYDLRHSMLVPVATVICPRRVLAMSMDVSSGRHAVAALLEGRMGIVCELRFGQKPNPHSPVEILVGSHDQPYRTIPSGASISSSRMGDLGFGVNAADRELIFGDVSDSRTPYIESVDVQSNYQAVSLHGVHDQRTYAQNYINNTWNLDLRGPRQNGSQGNFDESHAGCALPVEDGTSTFYRHLCSEDDPPRSGMHSFVNRAEQSQTRSFQYNVRYVMLTCVSLYLSSTSLRGIR